MIVAVSAGFKVPGVPDAAVHLRSLSNPVLLFILTSVLLLKNVKNTNT